MVQAVRLKIDHSNRIGIRPKLHAVDKGAKKLDAVVRPGMLIAKVEKGCSPNSSHEFDRNSHESRLGQKPREDVGMLLPPLPL